MAEFNPPIGSYRTASAPNGVMFFDLDQYLNGAEAAEKAFKLVCEKGQVVLNGVLTVGITNALRAAAKRTETRISIKTQGGISLLSLL